MCFDHSEKTASSAISASREAAPSPRFISALVFSLFLSVTLLCFLFSGYSWHHFGRAPSKPPEGQSRSEGSAEGTQRKGRK